LLASAGRAVQTPNRYASRIRRLPRYCDRLESQIKKSLGRGGPGAFTIPGLLKIEKKRVPARAAKKGVPNPFKPGEPMDVAARPASNKDDEESPVRRPAEPAHGVSGDRFGPFTASAIRFS
jgi:hypothetical protein